MDEGEVTLWLQEHGRAAKLNVDLARQLARESRLGWYVAPHSHNRFAIGKFTLAKVSSRHIVTDAKGNALTFDTVIDAKRFLQSEFGIDASEVFGY